MSRDKQQRQTPSPIETTHTYSSWTSSVHTTATNPNSVMTNRGGPSESSDQASREHQTGQRTTQLGDFMNPSPYEGLQQNPSPSIRQPEQVLQPAPRQEAESIRTISNSTIRTNPNPHTSASTIRRAGPYENQRQGTPPFVQQPQPDSYETQRQATQFVIQQPQAQHRPLNILRISTEPRRRDSEGSTLVGSPETGEQFWPAENRSRGERVQQKYERGILTSAGANDQLWRHDCENILRYHFHDPDLLEEALEAPGSGVICVGGRPRIIENGNEDLAKVGARVMELIIRDQMYIFKTPVADQKKILDQLLGGNKLYNVGKKSRLEQFMRRKAPKYTQKNILALMKQDIHNEDAYRSIPRAMRAIIAAIYYDGGLDAARRVMAGLQLVLVGRGGRESLNTRTRES